MRQNLIPKAAREKAERVRMKYQKRAGINSQGVSSSKSGKTQVAEWEWTMRPTNPVYKQIKEDVKLSGGQVFKGKSVGGGEYSFYAAFTTHK